MESPPRKPINLLYQEIEDRDSDLEQGDILQASEELCSIFHGAYKDIFDEKYLAFIVITQTCDMVRRGKGEKRECKSKIINLAGVKPLADIWSSLVDKVCEKVVVGGNPVPNIYEGDTKSKAHELLTRIVNQNGQAEGIFYLHPDGAIQIGNNAVAILQISIGVGSQHYNKLLAARTGRLAAPFQSKLGWLTGNLFSRIATEDQKDTVIKDVTKKFLGAGQRTLNWVPRSKARSAQTRDYDPTGKTVNEIVAFINSQPDSLRDTILKTIIDLVKQAIPSASDEETEYLKALLASNNVIKSAIGV